jgi:hypothetical protein
LQKLQEYKIDSVKTEYLIKNEKPNLQVIFFSRASIFYVKTCSFHLLLPENLSFSGEPFDHILSKLVRLENGRLSLSLGNYQILRSHGFD